MSEFSNVPTTPKGFVSPTQTVVGAEDVKANSPPKMGKLTPPAKKGNEVTVASILNWDSLLYSGPALVVSLVLAYMVAQMSPYRLAFTYFPFILAGLSLLEFGWRARYNGASLLDMVRPESRYQLRESHVDQIGQLIHHSLNDALRTAQDIVFVKNLQNTALAALGIWVAPRLAQVFSTTFLALSTVLFLFLKAPVGRKYVQNKEVVDAHVEKLRAEVQTQFGIYVERVSVYTEQARASFDRAAGPYVQKVSEAMPKSLFGGQTKQD